MLEPGPAEKKYVGTLLSGLRILDMFTRDQQVLGIGEIAHALDLHKSSASRLAATLAHAGYLRLAGSQGTYRLGGRLAALGQLARQGTDLVEWVRPHLEQLTLVTGETGHLAVLKGQDAITLAVTEGWHTIRMHSWEGKTSRAYISSMGKALLTQFSSKDLRDIYGTDTFEKFTPKTTGSMDELIREIRRVQVLGYGVDDEEMEIGMRCVSAPVFDSAGDVVASISISGPSQRLVPSVVPEVAEHVRWHAAQASRDLGALRGAPADWPAVPDQQPEPPSYLANLRKPGDSHQQN